MSGMTYCVLDIETNCFEDVHMGSHPYSFNTIVDVGIRTVSGAGSLSTINAGSDVLFQTDFVVGFNLSFDLGKMLRFGMIKTVPYIWDCQYYYYLTNNHKTFPSLEEVASAYGIPGGKTLDIYEEAKKHGDVRNIPEFDRHKYLHQDLSLTHDVFMWQETHFLNGDERFQRFIMMKMLGLRQSIISTSIGISCKAENISAEILKAGHEIQVVLDEVKDLLMSELVQNNGINPQALASDCIDVAGFLGGRKQILNLINGLPVTIEYRCKTGTYKSGLRAGTPKYTTRTGTVFPGNVLSDSFTSVTEEDLSAYLKTYNACTSCTPEQHVRAYTVHRILSFRKLSKFEGTYLDNLLKYNVNNRIHSSFQHCATISGRISSTGPNMQNQL